MSVISSQIEARRQADTDDRKFWQSLVYYFELKLPAEVLSDPVSAGSGASYLFPLILNPQSISMSEPFAVQATPTVNGGLFVEENGIIEKVLRIEGTTGFRPRPLAGGIFQQPPNVHLENQSFGSRGNSTPAWLSGHRHFQFLQDKVFRTYGDLKRNPATAKDTQLIWHNPKDDEHWIVAPTRFDMNRDAKERVLYRYSIELLVVAPGARGSENVRTAEAEVFKKLPTFYGTSVFKSTALQHIRVHAEAAESWLGQLKKIIDKIVAVVAWAGALVKTVQAKIRGVIQTIETVLQAVKAFVAGVVAILAAPFRIFTDVLNALAGIAGMINDLTHIDDLVRAEWLSITRGLDDAWSALTVSVKSLVRQPLDAKLDELNRQSRISKWVSDVSLNRAAAGASGLSGGTAPLASDRALAALENQRLPPIQTLAFRSTIEHQLSGVDTLQSLAAVYLGDARLWRAIAVLNSLRSPYISDQGLPGTLASGARILIPSFAASSVPTNVGIVGALAEQTLAEQLLGIDFRADPVYGTDQVDLVVDPATHTDVLATAGVPNLEQAIRTRTSTERGTDVLYPDLGYRRLIGVGNRDIDDEITRFRMTESVAADPRIASVQNVITHVQSPDTVDVEFDASVRGFSKPIPVNTAVT